MQILARIFYFIFWVVIVTWLFRGVFGWLFGRKSRQRVPAPGRAQTPPAARTLYRDPVCGTHVSPDISQRFEHEGQVLHFCSTECRERYRAGLRQKVSA
ncbi:MAG TPA: hypothetical protein VD793_06595 [Gemmatimonadales bacterium]|nr:hypothetical protein [Gemmatimonadales bacterium]